MYSAKSAAKDGIDSVKRTGVVAESFKAIEAWSGGWVVTLVSSNGETIARGESYASKSNATRAIKRIVEILSGDVVVPQ